MTSMQRWKAFLLPKLRRIAEFFGSQGITTAGNLLYGLLCVRLLPISDYAEFAVVFGFLGTLTVLMDIGISSTLLPLVGERIDDSQLIADYVASLRQLAHWLYVAVVPLIIIVYPLAVQRQHWNWPVIAAMVAILLVAGWSARISGSYGAVLICRRDHTFWYRVQMISSLGTLFLLGIIWSLHSLNAFSAILINVAGIIFNGTAYYFRARHLLGVKGHASKEKRKAIVHLALPSMPNTIFYAFQGQIAIFLITLFGGIGGIAAVGALSRLFPALCPLFANEPTPSRALFRELAQSAPQEKLPGSRSFGRHIWCSRGYTVAALPGAILVDPRATICRFPL